MEIQSVISIDSKVQDSRLHTNTKRNDVFGDASASKMSQHQFQLKSILSSKKGSSKDPDLSAENNQVTSQYPFFYSKSESNPILNRYRSTTRTKTHFSNIEKLNIDTPETIQRKLDESNPYCVNRPLRSITKSQFANNEGVQRLLSTNEGQVQQQQLKNFLKLNDSVREGREKAKKIEDRQLAEKKQKNFLSNREYMK